MCQFCGKSFAQAGELTIHNRSHTNERPFQCTICNKSYKTSSMRASHMDSHIEGKTFTVSYYEIFFRFLNFNVVCIILFLCSVIYVVRNYKPELAIEII